MCSFARLRGSPTSPMIVPLSWAGCVLRRAAREHHGENEGENDPEEAAPHARSSFRAMLRRVRSATSPASWPQAAAMSSPRVLRVVTVSPARCSTSAKRRMRSGAERLKPELRERIERDQVELAAHLAGERDELARVRVAVVHAVEHHVFEGDEIARRLVEIALAGLGELGERVLAVDRHQAVAQRVVGRVQRDGERHRAFVAQAVDARDHAGGGDRHAAPRKAVGIVVEHQPQRRNHVVEVQQRLPHAHHDHVGHGSFAEIIFLQQAVREPKLADDLGAWRGCG